MAQEPSHRDVAHRTRLKMQDPPSNLHHLSTFPQSPRIQRTPPTTMTTMAATEQTALLTRKSEKELAFSLEDPQHRAVSVWELRVLLVPCT